VNEPPPSTDTETLTAVFEGARAQRTTIARQVDEMQRATHDATYAVIVVNNHARNFAPFISPLRWLPVTARMLALFGETSTAEFVMAPNAAAHLGERRPKDAAMLSTALQGRVEYLYYGQRYPGTRKYELVVRAPDGTVIFLALKFIAAAKSGSGVDECIATTAHEIDEAEIRRLVRRGRLRPVSR
jgi:hypothetical protein